MNRDRWYYACWKTELLCTTIWRQTKCLACLGAHEGYVMFIYVSVSLLFVYVTCNLYVYVHNLSLYSISENHQFFYEVIVSPSSHLVAISSYYTRVTTSATRLTRRKFWLIGVFHITCQSDWGYLCLSKGQNIPWILTINSKSRKEYKEDTHTHKKKLH